MTSPHCLASLSIIEALVFHQHMLDGATWWSGMVHVCIVCTHSYRLASICAIKSIFTYTIFVMASTLFLFHLCYFYVHCLYALLLPLSPPSNLTPVSPLGFSFNSTILLQYSSFSLPHLGANEFWMWSVWGPKLLPYCHLSSWVLPRCTKCLSWILNKAQDLLRASWSTALLLWCYYSAWGPGAPAGWMGFESVVLWAKVEIIGMGGLSVWSCLILSLVIMKPFLSVL